MMCSSRVVLLGHCLPGSRLAYFVSSATELGRSHRPVPPSGSKWCACLISPGHSPKEVDCAVGAVNVLNMRSLSRFTAGR